MSEPTPESTTGTVKATTNKRPFYKGFIELIVIVVAALLMSFVLKTYVVQNFYIPSGSMENTLRINDRIMVNKMASDEKDLNRGDVVVFKDTKGWLAPLSPKEQNNSLLDKTMQAIGIMPEDNNQYLVKRIIGMPGDTVKCCDADGRILINGEAIDEPYLYPGDKPAERYFFAKVPEGKVWVMGDHRSNSADSRAHRNMPGEGFIDIKDISGRGAFIVWPLENAGKIDRPSEVFKNIPAPQTTN